MTELEILKEENNRLRAELETLKAEHLTIVKTVIRVLKSVELWPLAANDNVASKAMKGVKSVIAQAMINPKALEERFSFIKDIVPLAEKYKDIEV